jgi:hypothetical protein
MLSYNQWLGRYWMEESKRNVCRREFDDEWFIKYLYLNGSRFFYKLELSASITPEVGTRPSLEEL